VNRLERALLTVQIYRRARSLSRRTRLPISICIDAVLAEIVMREQAVTAATVAQACCDQRMADRN
jgi:hypothetical protein